MAYYEVVKPAGGSLSLKNHYLRMFVDDLVAAVQTASKEIAVEISSQPAQAFGIAQRVQQGAGDPSALAAQNFSSALPASHANAYARHFMAYGGRTTRMDMGNLVEQRAYEHLKKPGWIYSWKEGEHFLYQVSVAQPPLFPIKFVGNKKSARPDFRYAFYGNEVLFDITTPSQKGHLLQKAVNGVTVANHGKVVMAIEVIWEDGDFYY